MRDIDDMIKAHVTAFRFYRTFIEEQSDAIFNLFVEPVNYSEYVTFSDLNVNKQLDHAMWMCQEMLAMVHNNPEIEIDKMARWLGFVQGVIITNGLTDIQTERDRTRPWFKGEEIV